MDIKVDIANTEGTSLTAGSAARTVPAYKTEVFDKSSQEADTIISGIIAKNNAPNSAIAAR